MESTDILSQIRNFQIGPFTFHTYGLITGIAVAIVILGLSNRLPRKITERKDFLLFLIIGLVSALLFGRLFFVVGHWNLYKYNLLEIFEVWKGGTTIFGVIFGGILSTLTYWKLRIEKEVKLSYWTFLDPLCIFLALGQCIGRWANFINEELYGRPTDLPWKIFISPQNRIPGYEKFEHFHPTFLYESILNLINFAMLFTISKILARKKISSPGLIAGIYLINYGIIRIVMERFRIESDPVLWIMKPADVLGLLMVISGVVIAIQKRGKTNVDEKLLFPQESRNAGLRS